MNMCANQLLRRAGQPRRPFHQKVASYRLPHFGCVLYMPWAGSRRAASRSGRWPTAHPRCWCARSSDRRCRSGTGHRHDRRLDRDDHHRLRRRALDREGRAGLCETTMTNEELLRERVARLEVQMNTRRGSKGAMGDRRLAGVAGLASGLVAKFMPWSGVWPR